MTTRSEKIAQMLRSTDIVIEDDDWHMEAAKFIRELDDDELVELLRKALFVCGMRLAGVFTESSVMGSLELALEGTKTVLKLIEKSVKDHKAYD